MKNITESYNEPRLCTGLHLNAYVQINVTYVVLWSLKAVRLLIRLALDRQKPINIDEWTDA